MDYQNLTPAEKTKVLEYAAINCTYKEIANICTKLGGVEYSARALGIACRFRGVECVRALVEGGASFHAPLTNYMVETYGSYGDNLSVMLLDKTPTKVIPYFIIAQQYVKQLKQDNGNILTPLPVEKRIEILDYLCENQEKAAFDPGELLYYAIIFKDDFMMSELEKRGANFSEYRIKMLTDKGERRDLYIWSGALQLLSAEDFVPVLSQIAKRTNGKKLHCTNGIYDACFGKLYGYDNLRFYFDNFDNPKVNKTDIMSYAISRDNAGGLDFAAHEGWLKSPKKRDEMIQFANEKNAAECSAYLLNFKNSTADFAAERAKSEKKANRELNAAPNSVTALKLLWNYKKREDGNIIITGYKGTQTVITVPAKIGKGKVVAIGKEAFSPHAARLNDKARAFRKTITEVKLPDSIDEIGEGAFISCNELRRVNIPHGITEIKKHTFSDCISLENIVIPSSVKLINSYALFKCDSLKHLIIPEGVSEIDISATALCSQLEYVELPRSLKAIDKEKDNFDHIFFFSYNLKNVIVPKSSYAEEYCQKHNIPYICKEEK